MKECEEGKRGACAGVDLVSGVEPSSEELLMFRNGVLAITVVDWYVMDPIGVENAHVGMGR